MFVLRDYQTECIDKISANFREYNSQLIQLPTGSGKTVILWHFIKQSGLKALIVAPTRELTFQIYDTGCAVVGEDNVYLKTRSYLPKGNQSMVMTMQALTFFSKRKVFDEFDFDILIIDEAHRAQADSYLKFIDKHIKDTERLVLGLTATPERLDKKNLMDVFQVLSYKKTLIELIQEDYLVDISCWRVRTGAKMQDVRYYNGDFSFYSLAQLDTPQRNGILLDIVQTKCGNKKTLIFCLSVDHAKAIAKILRDRGFSAASIDGKTPQGKRKEILDKFKSGEIQVLCNCQLLTEGFDEPSIECIIIARPTKSKSLYCQMVGRGVRPFKNKGCCFLYDMTDEHFNICNFNALGGIPNQDDFPEPKNGAMISRIFKDYEEQFGKVEKADYHIDAFDIVGFSEKIDFEFEKKPAMSHQKDLLKERRVPFMNDLTIHEAAFLLWKDVMMGEYGLDYKKKWKVASKNKQAWAEASFCNLC